MREPNERGSIITGVILTVALHVCLLTLVSFTGLKYIYPPPEEKSVLIDFEELPTPPPQQQEEIFSDTPVDKEKPIETARSNEESVSPDPRALFPGMARRDTAAVKKSSDEESGTDNKEGKPGKPNAHVEGRNTVGNIPRPVYNVQESGTVVVNIWVDNYGNVAKAVPGGDGTTVTNQALWTAARKAALETHFNMSADAPAMQEGTITYIFNLK